MSATATLLFECLRAVVAPACRYRSGVTAGVAFVLILALGLSSPSHADLLYNADGFESPRFGVGAVVGQDGWVQLGGRSSNAAVHAAGAPVADGGQGLTLNRSGNDNGAATYFNVPLGQLPDHDRYVVINWDLYASSQTDPEAFGPGFSIEAYTTGTQRVAAVGIDAADGALYEVIDNGLPSVPTFTNLPGVRLDEWQNWQLTLDFVAETYGVAVDGVSAIANAPMLEDIDYAGGDRLIDASITLHPTDTNFFDAAGVAYLDNYYIREDAFAANPGDYNASGLVEQGDLNLVLNNWGRPANPTPANWVNDLPSGIVDQAELNRVLNNWGSVAVPDAAAAAVPEPAATGLALTAVAVFMTRAIRSEHRMYPWGGFR